MFAHFGEFFMPMQIYISDIVFQLIVVVLSIISLYHINLMILSGTNPTMAEMRHLCAVSFVKSFIKACRHSTVN